MTKVLVDTTVWVAHFKSADAEFARLLELDRVVCHPYVVLEVAAGRPDKRATVIQNLLRLQMLSPATTAEVLHSTLHRRLAGRGCGMVDLCLLTAVLIAGQTQLWTLDKRLHRLANEMGCAYASTPFRQA